MRTLIEKLYQVTVCVLAGAFTVILIDTFLHQVPRFMDVLVVTFVTYSVFFDRR